ncbi:S66 peptidase family protein [Rubrivirga sp.]|uniref:S66 peptidase family protein n=1 Tax=Rubrivirga sp. TaxID=1885344 RepID=UPI003B521200
MPLPRPLAPTGRVAVVAPASAPLDPADAHAGLSVLRERGLRVETADPAGGPAAYLAGTDDARVAALNAALARDDLDALVCVRGGYGVLRILDRVDYAAARAHPKLVVGYSDVTALHLALWKEAGLPGVSGPMVASDWGVGLDAETEADFWRVVGGDAGYDVRGPGGEALTPLAPGEAEGVLLGGNLALVTALLGTPFLPDLTGAILFVEDVGEAPYRIDGMLARLRLAGVLGRLGGLVFGMFTGADVAPGRPTFSVDEVLAHYAPSVGGPVASGLVYGHVPRKSTLPVGVRARLTCGAEARLHVLDPVAA